MIDIGEWYTYIRAMFMAGQAADAAAEAYNGWISPDFARDLFFTALTFGIGWIFSLRASKGRLKGRIIDELIQSQRELVGRAYPDQRGGRWRSDDQRDVWMLDPFVARIKFLISSLSEEKSLSEKELSLLENYVVTLEDFISQWAKTTRRMTTYHYKYKTSYHALRAAVKALGLKKMKRLAGLMPKDDLLDGGGKETAAPALFGDESGVPPNGAMAPAE